MITTKELREQLNEMIKSGNPETVLCDPAVIRRALEIEHLLELIAAAE